MTFTERDLRARERAFSRASRRTAVSRVARCFVEGAAQTLSEHWLAAVNALLALLGGLPWVAPWLMAQGMEWPARIIYYSYRLLCHQLPSRSFFLFGPKLMYSNGELQALATQHEAGLWRFQRFLGDAATGYKVAWSDRMVAMWAGLLLGGLLYGLLREKMRSMGLRAFLLCLLPIALDGMSHMVSDFRGVDAGFRQDNAWLAALTGHVLSDGFYSGSALGSFNSWMRLGSGVLSGLAVAWLLYPRVGSTGGSWRRDARPVKDGERVQRPHSPRRVTNALRLGLLGLMAALLVGCTAALRGGAAAAQNGSARTKPGGVEAQSLPAASPEATAPLAPPRPGDAAPDFWLEDLNGNQVSLSQYRGEVVLLNFWASWCAPCRIEIPDLMRVHAARHDAGFQILAINVREPRATAERFVDEVGMEFPVLLDSRGEVVRLYYIRGIPASVLIGRDGIIRDVHVGLIAEGRLRAAIAPLLAEQGVSGDG